MPIITVNHAQCERCGFRERIVDPSEPPVPPPMWATVPHPMTQPTTWVLVCPKCMEEFGEWLRPIARGTGDWPLPPADALASIYAELNGVEWDNQTIERVAEIVEKAGFHIEMAVD